MKFLIVFLVGLAHARHDGLKSILESPTKTLELYKKFKGEQHLQFSSTEEGMRFRVFKLNAHFVASENDVEGETAHFALNMFSTMTEAEKQSYLGINSTRLDTGHRFTEDLRVKRGSVPSEKLWTNDGKVTPVKNQGSCGSCWSFGAVGGLETRYASSTGVLRDFAEQEYLNCVYEWDRDGCSGGLPRECYEYSTENGRLAPTSDNPYIGLSFDCEASSTKNGLVAAVITETVFVGTTEADNIAALAEGSLSMLIEATTRFQSYSGGVLTDTTCSSSPNHAVTGVGYTQNYILLKNSWGSTWGEQGFIKVTRGYPSGCMLFQYSTYPALSSTGVKDDIVSDPATSYNPKNTPDDSGEETLCENTVSTTLCKYYQDSFNYCKYDWFVEDYCRDFCTGCCANGTKLCGGVCRHELMC